jgi:hypothetical protein
MTTPYEASEAGPWAALALRELRASSMHCLRVDATVPLCRYVFNTPYQLFA